MPLNLYNLLFKNEERRGNYLFFTKSLISTVKFLLHNLLQCTYDCSFRFPAISWIFCLRFVLAVLWFHCKTFQSWNARNEPSISIFWFMKHSWQLEEQDACYAYYICTYWKYVRVCVYLIIQYTQLRIQATTLCVILRTELRALIDVVEHFQLNFAW